MQELAARLEELKVRLERPLTKKERKKMAKKKVVKKNSAKAPAESKAEAAAEDENTVSLSELCEEVGITPQAARRKLRASNLVKQGRWAWAPDSDELEEAREVISSKREKEESAEA